MAADNSAIFAKLFMEKREKCVTFRTQTQEGLAVSEIVEVLATNPPSNDDLPVMFSPETAVMETPTVTDSERRTNPPIVERIPFAYQEQTPVSEAMFLGTLVNVVSGVASRLAPIIAEALPHVESPKLLSVVASLNSNRSDVHYTVSALRTRSSS